MLVCLVVSLSGAQAQDVEAGHEIARRWCNGCHETESAPPRNDLIPSFVSIARLTSTTKSSLGVFLGTPHYNMPDYSLSRQEIRDVSAYILSLK